MHRIKFLTESLKNIRTTGTVTRSSRVLCKAMIKPIDFENARFLVEIGAGDGVITKHILKNMHPDAKLLCFEVNPIFCEKIKSINDDRLIVIQDSAEHLTAYIDKHNFSELDGVISAIPFVSLPRELAYTIVGLCEKHLKKNAPFTQMHYSLILKKIYEDIFGAVKVKFVALNIPPAFVLLARKS